MFSLSETENTEHDFTPSMHEGKRLGGDSENM